MLVFKGIATNAIEFRSDKKSWMSLWRSSTQIHLDPLIWCLLGKADQSVQSHIKEKPNSSNVISQFVTF